MAVWVATSFEGEAYTNAISQYLGSAENTGEAIDKGTVSLLVGFAFVLLGTLVRRSRA